MTTEAKADLSPHGDGGPPATKAADKVEASHERTRGALLSSRAPPYGLPAHDGSTSTLDAVVGPAPGMNAKNRVYGRSTEIAAPRGSASGPAQESRVWGAPRLSGL